VTEEPQTPPSETPDEIGHEEMASDPLPPLYVLVAEDVKVNQMVIKAMLERDGHVVTVAANGRQAVMAVREQDYDMILMDVQMPEMDGVEATRHIRAMPEERAARTPILAMTANLLDGDADRCIAAGMTGILVKPLNPTELNAVLQRLFAIDAPPLPAPVLTVSDPDRVFDTAPVSQLLEVLPPAKVASLLDGAKASITASRASLMEASVAGDVVSMETHAHKLAGVAGIFGCPKLMALARRIEAAARDDAGGLLAQLQGVLAEAVAALDAEKAKIA